MNGRVCLETTIVRYLTALPTRDLVRTAHQQLTNEWWQRRDRFELFVSEAVVQEAAAGDKGAAARRLGALHGIPVLAITPPAITLARALIDARAVPPQAAVDALHIAIAASNGINFLLTWNCAHIANAATRSNIENTCRALGLVPPVICTPEELMEDQLWLRTPSSKKFAQCGTSSQSAMTTIWTRSLALYRKPPSRLAGNSFTTATEAR